MSHAATQSNYDRLSRWYDRFSASEKRFTQAGLNLLAPRPGQRVLEIGCGTGHALASLAGAGTSVFGLDLSRGMLLRSRQVLERTGHGQVSLCQGDALRLPVPPRSFDSVFLSFTLELFPDEEIPLLLDECHRTLRWDGQLGVVALARENTRAVRVYDWFHRRWPQVVDCRPIYLHSALIRSGFEIHEARRMVMWGLPVEILTARKA